jgi:hypothetical protein
MKDCKICGLQYFGKSWYTWFQSFKKITRNRKNGKKEQDQGDDDDSVLFREDLAFTVIDFVPEAALADNSSDPADW